MVSSLQSVPGLTNQIYTLDSTPKNRKKKIIFLIIPIVLFTSKTRSFLFKINSVPGNLLKTFFTIFAQNIAMSSQTSTTTIPYYFGYHLTLFMSYDFQILIFIYIKYV